MYLIACEGNKEKYSHLIGLKAAFLTSVFMEYFLCHYWIFTVKYLETGLLYTFPTSSIHKEVRHTLILCYLPYLAFSTGLNIYLYCTLPVFRPPDNLNPQECEAAFADYTTRLINWAEKVDAIPYPDYLPSLYYGSNVILSGAGLGMICRATRAIAQTNDQIKINFGQYVWHMLALAALLTIYVLYYFDGLYYCFALIDGTECMISVLLCYIVTKQASTPPEMD